MTSRTVGGGPLLLSETHVPILFDQGKILSPSSIHQQFLQFPGGLAFTQRKRTQQHKRKGKRKPIFFVLGLMMKKVSSQLPATQQDPSGMYPKVKERTESQREDRGIAASPHEHDWSSLLSLKDIQFLSLQEDTYFPGKRSRDVSPLTLARIPKWYVPSVSVPSEPIADEEKVHVISAEVDKRTNSDEEEDARIRASSIPRPRAVISSPDNDALIGHKNKTTAIRPAVSNNRTSIPNRHLQRCKIVPTCTEEESPASTVNSKDIADAKAETKGTVAAGTGRRRQTAMRQRSPFRI